MSAYTYKQNLTGHLFKVHKLGAPHKCECGKVFAWASRLSEHKRLNCPLTDDNNTAKEIHMDAPNNASPSL